MSIDFIHKTLIESSLQQSVTLLCSASCNNIFIFECKRRFLHLLYVCNKSKHVPYASCAGVPLLWKINISVPLFPTFGQYKNTTNRLQIIIEPSFNLRKSRSNLVSWPDVLLNLISNTPKWCLSILDIFEFMPSEKLGTLVSEQLKELKLEKLLC